MSLAVHGSSSVDGPQVSAKLAAEVPLFGPDDPYPCLCMIPEDDARRLLKQGKVTIHRVTKELRGVRIIEELPRSKQKPTAVRGRMIGKPTQSESIDNPTGCWTFTSPGKKPATSLNYRALPAWAERYLFQSVTLDCTLKRAA